MEQFGKNTALLVMDMQSGIIGALPNATGVLPKIAQSIACARENKIPVIYVTVGFRQGAPEVSANNKGVAAVKERFATVNMDEFIKVHPDLRPQDGELTVLKRRLSAFSGSDLDLVLRALGIQHLVLTGISTSGVVLSTLREATDKDYRLTVLADCCAERLLWAALSSLARTSMCPGVVGSQ
ncbi:MAG: isochorismatase family cysteine hydrolase [Bacteroidota bacterium]|nr:isochorismatase family cysteine hydrolase [Bacteroidota bacterium]